MKYVRYFRFLSIFPILSVLGIIAALSYATALPIWVIILLSIAGSCNVAALVVIELVWWYGKKVMANPFSMLGKGLGL